MLVDGDARRASEAKRVLRMGGAGHEPSRSPRKKARREASGGASVASEPSLQFPHEDPASAERVSASYAWKALTRSPAARFLRGGKAPPHPHARLRARCWQPKACLCCANNLNPRPRASVAPAYLALQGMPSTAGSIAPHSEKATLQAHPSPEESAKLRKNASPRPPPPKQ